jgi:predicted DNA-binding transcriptional regulator AlpA
MSSPSTKGEGVIMLQVSARDASLPRFALRRDEAAASLAISETTFEAWIKLKRMPKGRKIDGVMLWDVQEIREYWYRLRDNEGEPKSNPFDGVTA